MLAFVPVSWWIAFNAFVIFMLALDLGVFHRKAHVVKIKEALGWTVFWIVLALAFNVWVYFELGPKTAQSFFAAYLLEKSLSVDNVFVFAVIFSFFKVPRELQHKVLFWGIFGALVMRAAMIAGGITLINNFVWVTYIFAVILIYTGVKMFVHDDESVDPGNNIAVRLLRKVMPITNDFHGDRFLIRKDQRLWATPLFAVLLCIEVTDVVFAVDSIPAIFTLIKDIPRQDQLFIIYTSNVFAILGLRALFFAIAGILPYFYYLKYGLGVVLVFVGIKMGLAHTQFHIDISVSLFVIASVLAISMIASVIRMKRNSRQVSKLEDQE